MVDVVAMIERCPLCGREPDVDECGPPPPGMKPIGYYVNCYGMDPIEHNIGVDAATRAQAITEWNAQVKRTRAGILTFPATSDPVGFTDEQVKS